MNIQGLQEYREQWHRELLKGIYEYKFDLIVSNKDLDPVISNGHQVILGVPGVPIGQFAQRDDFHSYSVEDHQRCAGLLANTLLEGIVEIYDFDYGDDIKYRDMLDVFKGNFQSNSEEVNLKSEIGRLSRKTIEKLISDKKVTVEELEALGIWARFHDEEKYREPELHISTSTGQGRGVEGIPTGETGTRKIAKFPNPMYRETEAERENDNGTLQFFSELHHEGTITEEEYKNIREIHQRYTKFNDPIKAGVDTDVPNVEGAKDLLGIIAMGIDECSKQTPTSRRNASEGVEKQRLYQLKKVVELLSSS